MLILNTQTLELTPEQSAIVAHDLGPALVFAVAGAGKTTAMVHRIERLVSEGIFAPKRILATSFGKATVDELKTRLQAWPHCAEVRPMTLHGIGWRVIKQMQAKGLMPANFVLPDGEDGGRQVYYQTLKAARQQKADFDDLDAIVCEDFLDWVGQCKGNLQYADLEAEISSGRLPEQAQELARQAQAPNGKGDYLTLYQLFEKVRTELGRLTFDDLLLGCWEAFVSCPTLLATWQEQYDCLLVDEFQDINLAQSEILDLLSRRHSNYMAIGDDDQTIYQWRGASPDFILGFIDRYAARRYTLSDNFRSHASHLVLANAVITQNELREPKRLQLTRGFAGLTRIHPCTDSPQMGQDVVRVIDEALSAGVPYNEIAVLVRTYAQTPYIERALIDRNIPYHLPDGRQFFHRPEIRDLLSYVTLAIIDHQLEAEAGQTFSDEAFAQWSQHWNRVRNRPTRYVSNAIAQDIVKIMLRDCVSLSQALRSCAAICEDYLGNRLREFAGLLGWLTTSWREQRNGAEILTALEQKLGWCDWLISSSPGSEGRDRADNVKAFLDFASELGSLQELLDELRRLSQGQQETRKQHHGNSVTLSSIHRAKGLEWHTVLIPGCNDGIYPLERESDIEAERRLFYVALTRPRHSLHLFWHREAPISSFLRTADSESRLVRVQRLGELLETPPADWEWSHIHQLFELAAPLQLESYFKHWHSFPDDLLRRIQGCLNWMQGEELWHKTKLDPRLRAIWCGSEAARQVLLDPDETESLMAVFCAPVRSLAPGQVRHARHGIGTVVKSGVGKNQDMLLINFAGKGKMQLPADDEELEK